MIQAIGLIAAIAVRFRSIAPILGRFLRSSGVLVTAAKYIGKFMLSPMSWFALVIGSALFPQVIGSITQLVGIGLIKMAMVSFRFLSTLINTSTNIEGDYQTVTQELGNAIQGLPPQMISIMGQLGIVSLLGTIFLTMVTVGIMFTLASIVRRY